MLTLTHTITAYTLQELKSLGGDHERAYDNALVSILAWLNQDDYWTENITENLQNYLDTETRIRGKIISWDENPLEVVLSGDINIDDYLIVHRLRRDNYSLAHWTKLGGIFDSAYSFNTQKTRFASLDFADDFATKWVSDLTRYTDWEGSKPRRFERLCEQIERIGRSLNSYIEAAESKLVAMVEGEFKYRRSNEFALEEAEAHDFLFDVDGNLVRI